MMHAVDYEEIATSTTVVGALTAAKVAAMGNVKSYGLIIVVGYPIVYRVDGAAPTSATLQEAAVGSVLRIDERISLSQFQFLSVGGAGHITCTYFKRT